MHDLRHNGLILLGAVLAAFGIKGFLLPGGFIDGGVTGVSMIVSHVTSLPLFAVVVIVNIPFLILAHQQFGRSFALRGFVAVALFAIALAVGTFPKVTADPVLTAVFGGGLIGAGVGLAIRGRAVLDGTEILALTLSKNSMLTVGDVILVLNVFVFFAAGVVYGVEPALYSVLTYFSASKTVDFLIHGVEEYYSVMVVSGKADALRSALIDDMGRSVTRFQGKGGLSEAELDIIYLVVTRLEVARIKSMVKELDEQAFIVVQHVSDVAGGVRRPKVIERLAGPG